MKKTLLPFVALLLAAATASAGSVPESCLDACTGGEGTIHVTGWAYDPDISSLSINVLVQIYADSSCTIRYGAERMLTADVSRPDVNQSRGITGNHGFDAEIPISDAGTYWVVVFALDATGDVPRQIGSTTSVTVAAPAVTVTVTQFNQSYPYFGRATVEYTIGGTLPAEAVAKIVLNTGDATATFVRSNIVAGANSHVIDFASSFGGALLLTNASFVVTIMEGLGGVQLWKNGPYWAECNVGATIPEKYGYYFWWGDTVGYTRTGAGWISVTDGTSISFSDSGTAASTSGKDNAALLSEGYIDSTGNLVAAYDAATAHLGTPWRMPTDAEFSALKNNCDTAWITTNGVSGRLVTGTGDYADRSIFLPAVGHGLNSNFVNPGLTGDYWSSTPYSANSSYACDLDFSSGYFTGGASGRFYGLPVRPVRRGFAPCSAEGIVTYDPPACTVKVTKFHQSYPYSGKARVEYTVGGTIPANAAAEITLSTDDASATFIRKGIVAGANTHVINFASSFGGALLLTNASFVVTITEAEQGGTELDGVQLWEDGPFWAECNVGATRPEEAGYYFWWGNAVGYRHENGTWVAADGSTSEFSTSTASTFGKDNAALLSEGWIDSTGHLAAAHDAATAHLGAPWRMPTDAELSALNGNCDWTWTTQNGVNGYVVRGRDDYASNSIFLPASGYGIRTSLGNVGSDGSFWSSVPCSDSPHRSWHLDFDAGQHRTSFAVRDYGFPVRPVRECDQ